MDTIRNNALTAIHLLDERIDHGPDDDERIAQVRKAITDLLDERERLRNIIDKASEAVHDALAGEVDINLTRLGDWLDGEPGLPPEAMLVPSQDDATSIFEAAQAVIDRWDTPLWKDVPATAVYIERLRSALLARREG